jgi:hypothetical protein
MLELSTRDFAIFADESILADMNAAMFVIYLESYTLIGAGRGLESLTRIIRAKGVKIAHGDQILIKDLLRAEKWRHSAYMRERSFIVDENGKLALVPEILPPEFWYPKFPFKHFNWVDSPTLPHTRWVRVRSESYERINLSAYKCEPIQIFRQFELTDAEYERGVLLHEKRELITNFTGYPAIIRVTRCAVNGAWIIDA